MFTNKEQLCQSFSQSIKEQKFKAKKIEVTPPPPLKASRVKHCDWRLQQIRSTVMTVFDNNHDNNDTEKRIYLFSESEIGRSTSIDLSIIFDLPVLKLCNWRLKQICSIVMTVFDNHNNDIKKNIYILRKWDRQVDVNWFVNYLRSSCS